MPVCLAILDFVTNGFDKWGSVSTMEESGLKPSYYEEFVKAGCHLGARAWEYILSRFEKSYGKHWYLLFPDGATPADSDAEHCFLEFLEQQQPKLETMLMHSGVPVHSSLKQNHRFADDEAFEHYVSNAVRLWFQNQYLASDEGKVYDTFRKHLDRSAVCVSIGQDMASSTSRPSKSRRASSSTGRSEWRYISAPRTPTKFTRKELLAKVNNNPALPVEPHPADPDNPDSRVRYGKPGQIPRWLEGTLQRAEGYVMAWWLARIYTQLDSVIRSGIITNDREGGRAIDLGDQAAQDHMLSSVVSSSNDPSDMLYESRQRRLIEDFTDYYQKHLAENPVLTALAFFRDRHLEPQLARSMFTDYRLRQLFAPALDQYEAEYQEIR